MDGIPFVYQVTYFGNKIIAMVQQYYIIPKAVVVQVPATCSLVTFTVSSEAAYISSDNVHLQIVQDIGRDVLQA